MESMRLLTSGDYADIFVDNDKVVKLFKEEIPKTKILYEALIQSRIEALGLSVPTIREVSVIDGRWAITMDYITGKSYAELIRENPDKTEQYIEEFVDIQVEIHCTKATKLSSLTDKLTRLINDNDELDEIRKYELLTRLEGMPKHTKLCHCNYNLDNVIQNENGVYILDWRNARLGNASADVANTYLQLALNDKNVADLYLEKFCEATFTSKKYVQQWLPIVAAARYELGYDNEKELLFSWIDVVEY